MLYMDELENIVLDEISQLQKAKYYMIPIIRCVQSIYSNKIKQLITKAWVEGKMRSYCLTDIEFQFYRIKRILEMNGDDGNTAL